MTNPFGFATNTASSTSSTTFNPFPFVSSTSATFSSNTAVSQSSSSLPSFSSFNFGSTTAGSTFAGSSFSAPFATAPVSSSLLNIHSSNPVDVLEAIAKEWDPSNVNCRFRHVFFNIVDPKLVPLLRERKPDNFPEKLWYQALQNVPDPSCMIPVQAVGFKDLKIRIQEQDKMTVQQLTTLKNIELYIAQLQQKHSLDTALKLEEYKRRHLELKRRVVYVMRKKEMLTTQGYALLKSEELFRARLESLQRELNKPNQFKAVLSDLQSSVNTMLHNAAASGGDNVTLARSFLGDETPLDRSTPSPQYEPLDDETLEKIYAFLEEQSKGLQQLTALLKSHLKHLQIISDGLTEASKLKFGSS